MSQLDEPGQELPSLSLGAPLYSRTRKVLGAQLFFIMYPLTQIMPAVRQVLAWWW